MQELRADVRDDTTRVAEHSCELAPTLHSPVHQ